MMIRSAHFVHYKDPDSRQILVLTVHRVNLVMPARERVQKRAKIRKLLMFCIFLSFLEVAREIPARSLDTRLPTESVLV